MVNNACKSKIPLAIKSNNMNNVLCDFNMIMRDKTEITFMSWRGYL